MGVGEAILVIGETLGFIADTVDLFTPETVIEQNTIFSTGGGIWVGSAEYTWTDSSGTRKTETLTCNFGGGNLYNGKSVASGPSVHAYLITQGSSGSVPSVSSSGTSITFSGGGYYDFELEWSGNNSKTPTSIVVTTGGASGATFTEGSGEGTGTWSGSSSHIIGRNASCSYSTNLNDLENGGHYIPSGNHTFNELRDELINYYNDEYGLNIDINIGSDEIPDWDTYFGDQDETEPTGSGDGFQFDYGEVISPTELESILDQETYELQEIETDPTDLPSLPSEELPTDTFSDEVLTGIPEVVQGSYSFLTGTELASVFIPMAVIMCIIKILRGD